MGNFCGCNFENQENTPESNSQSVISINFLKLINIIIL